MQDALSVPEFITAHGNGSRLAVRAQPRAKRPGMRGVSDGRLKIAVAAPAEDGRANSALLEYLADMAGVPRKAVSLVSGSTAREKVIDIQDIAPPELWRRLQAASAER